MDYSGDDVAQYDVRDVNNGKSYLKVKDKR